MRVRTIRAVPVAAPFIHIAAHVVKAKLVGLLGANGVSAVAVVDLIPCHVVNVVAAAVFVVAAVVATSCGKLPFGLGGQTEVTACIAVEAADKSLAVVPAHSFNWQVVAFEFRRVAAHDGSPKGLRYLIFADIVATEGDAVGWLFVVTSITALLACAAHGESAT